MGKQRAVAARYIQRSGTIAVALDSGLELRFKSELVPELRHASDRDLKQSKLLQADRGCVGRPSTQISISPVFSMAALDRRGATSMPSYYWIWREADQSICLRAGCIVVILDVPGLAGTFSGDGEYV